MKRSPASARHAKRLLKILRTRGAVTTLSLAFQNIDALATAKGAGGRVDRSPSTVHRWKRAGLAIAFRPRGAKRDLFPIAQFSHGGVAPWAQHIVKVVGNGTAAFHFLMVGRKSLGGESYSKRILSGDQSAADSISEQLSRLETH